ncbi:hypothetical protein BGZ81_000846 [Podila clonocystis]|nr:hypothetical protein BGZ81_000846 [Podila clonocystis]
MLANKTIRFAITAAVFMLIATVQAAPTKTPEREACDFCWNPAPYCTYECSPGWRCAFNDCTCQWGCTKILIP